MSQQPSHGPSPPRSFWPRRHQPSSPPRILIGAEVFWPPPFAGGLGRSRFLAGLGRHLGPHPAGRLLFGPSACLVMVAFVRAAQRIEAVLSSAAEPKADSRRSAVPAGATFAFTCAHAFPGKKLNVCSSLLRVRRRAPSARRNHTLGKFALKPKKNSCRAEVKTRLFPALPNFARALWSCGQSVGIRTRGRTSRPRGWKNRGGRFELKRLVVGRTGTSEDKRAGQHLLSRRWPLKGSHHSLATVDLAAGGRTGAPPLLNRGTRPLKQTDRVGLFFGLLPGPFPTPARGY